MRVEDTIIVDDFSECFDVCGIPGFIVCCYDRHEFLPARQIIKLTVERISSLDARDNCCETATSLKFEQFTF